jgi:hypothetical protein
MLMSFMIYLALGISLDYLLAKYYYAIYRRFRCQASILSMTITLLTVFIIASVIKSNSVIPLFGYAIGNGIGTFLGIKK